MPENSQMQLYGAEARERGQPTAGVPTITFRRRDGTLLDEQAALCGQPQWCYQDDRIDPKRWCRVCTDRKESSDDRDNSCSFQGIRAVRIGTTTKPSTADMKYVTDGWLHEVTKDAIDTVGELTEDTHALEAPDGEDAVLLDLVLGKVATGIFPMVQQEYRHAAQAGRFVFYRQCSPADSPQCTHCASYMEGSWFCARCGAELCLTCFQAISDRTATVNVEGDTVFACNKTSADWIAHTAGTFMPLARRKTRSLTLQRMVARRGATRFYGQDSTSGAAAGHTVSAIEAVGAKFKQELAEKTGAPNDWTHLRNDFLGYTEIAKKPVMVIRIDKTMTTEERQRRVLRLALTTKDAFVIQQDVVPPLNTDQLLSLVEDEDELVLVKQFAKGAVRRVPIERNMKWKEVVAELTGKTKKLAYLDLRDFPGSADNLTELSADTVEMFRNACGFPSLCKTDCINDEDDREDIRILGDMATWCNFPRRDAKEKCYGALASDDNEAGTNLHVDEAGAMNVLMWAGHERTKEDDSDDMEVDDVPPTAEALDKRRAGAMWVVWPAHARHTFSRAAELVKEEDDQALGWAGDVLYSQTYFAEDAFVNKVVEIGGEDCRPRVILQRVGEAVYIPPGVPHQVINLRPCFKIARDIMPPSGVDQMVEVQRERSTATSHGKTMGVDACMIRPVLLWAWRACVATMAASPWAHEVGLGPTAEAVLNELTDITAEKTEDFQRMGRKVASMEKDIETLKKQTHQLSRKSGAACTADSTVAALQKIIDDYKEDKKPF